VGASLEMQPNLMAYSQQPTAYSAIYYANAQPTCHLPQRPPAPAHAEMEAMTTQMRNLQSSIASLLGANGAQAPPYLNELVNSSLMAEQAAPPQEKPRTKMKRRNAPLVAPVSPMSTSTNTSRFPTMDMLPPMSSKNISRFPTMDMLPPMSPTTPTSKAGDTSIVPKTEHKEQASGSLRSLLDDLRNEDQRFILITRGVKQLGFKSKQVLEKHFSQFGEVARVFVPTSKASRTNQHRPGNLGIVVMKSAKAVQDALAQGNPLVKNVQIHVSMYEADNEAETTRESASLAMQQSGQAVCQKVDAGCVSNSYNCELDMDHNRPSTYAQSGYGLNEPPKVGKSNTAASNAQMREVAQHVAQLQAALSGIITMSEQEEQKSKSRQQEQTQQDMIIQGNMQTPIRRQPGGPKPVGRQMELPDQKQEGDDHYQACNPEANANVHALASGVGAAMLQTKPYQQQTSGYTGSEDCPQGQFPRTSATRGSASNSSTELPSGGAFTRNTTVSTDEIAPVSVDTQSDGSDGGINAPSQQVTWQRFNSPESRFWG